MDEVAAAYTYPRQQIDVAGMNVAWVMTADIAATVREHGPDAYHRSLLAAGATAQRVADAAAGAGLFCRPARAVREDRIEAACAAPAGHDFVYLLLLGRSRVRDFGYDLTTLEVSR
jgi:hypothetical protein